MSDAPGRLQFLKAKSVNPLIANRSTLAQYQSLERTYIDLGGERVKNGFLKTMFLKPIGAKIEKIR